jgi:hypothetical protein
VFASRILHQIYPLEPEKSQLPEYLRDLERMNITLQDISEPDLAYLFKHVITQEVAYNLLLYSQRRLLHCLIAEWYERTQADNLAPFYPLLAYHWGKAEDRAKTIDYLDKAGEQALWLGPIGRRCDVSPRPLPRMPRSRRLGPIIHYAGRVGNGTWERPL